MTRTRATLLAVLFCSALAPAIAAQTVRPVTPAQATQSAPASQTQPALTPEQWMQRGSDALAVDDLQTAIHAFKTVAEAEPNNANVLILLADSYLRSNLPLAAKDLYERAQKMTPNDWRVHFGQGTVYLQQGYYRLARPYLERAAGLVPMQSRSRVLMNLALTFRGLHDLPPAIERARQAVAVEATNIDARRTLVSLYIEANQLDEAIAENHATLEMIRRDLASRPDDRKSVEHLVQVLSQEADLLQRKIAVQPDDPAPRLQLIEIIEQVSLANQQLQYHQGLELLAPVLEKAPDNLNVLVAHARLTYLVGRPQQAADSLQKALQISPNDGRARQLLERVEASLKTPEPK